jgi:hypothetical protein
MVAENLRGWEGDSERMEGHVRLITQVFALRSKVRFCSSALGGDHSHALQGHKTTA